MSTYSEAKSAGLTRYFTGAPCPRGHIAERLVSVRACIACLRERKREWSEQNPEKVNAQKRAYCNANLEKVKALKSANQKLHRAKANERSRRWYHENREKAKEATALWQRNNPSRVAAKAMKYHSDKMHRTPAWADLNAIDAVYAKASALRDAGQDVQVDHDIPLRGKMVSGLHVHNNLKILTAAENRSKSNHF